VYLLPPSPTDWLPEGHLAYFILEVVERLDLGPIEAVMAAKDPRGERAYSPRMLLVVLIYGYCVGIFSSRKLARATYEDVAFRVLCGDTHPHFTTINQYRLDYREAFIGLFVQVLRLCKKAGLVKLGHVSIDGTKILANASKHKAMSYDRMKQEEARLRAEINELLANADAVDRAEDERYGVGVAPEDLPEELKRRQARVQRIEEAMAALEREAAQARAAELDPPDDDDPPRSADGDLPRHRVPTTPDGTPEPKAQRNFTDPDSRIMVKGGEYVQAYNAQIVVDAKAQVIVANAVTNQPPDVEHLLPMLDRVERALGRQPKRASADSGYYSDANAAGCEARKVDGYIAVARTPHGETPKEQPAPVSATRVAMREKVQSPEGREVYSRRKVIAEPPFGQIKSAQGFRRFLLRGLAKVRCEWALVCTTHNLLKLFRAAFVPSLA
jgi:transposase